MHATLPKLDWNAKSEPPYLATTLNTLITLNFMQWPRAYNSMSKSQPTSTLNQHKLAQQFHTKFNQLKHESKLNKCSIYIPTLDPLLKESYRTSYNTWKWLQQMHNWKECHNKLSFLGRISQKSLNLARSLCPTQEVLQKLHSTWQKLHNLTGMLYVGHIRNPSWPQSNWCRINDDKLLSHPLVRAKQKSEYKLKIWPCTWGPCDFYSHWQSKNEMVKN
jgi:hypothetical protein